MWPFTKKKPKTNEQLTAPEQPKKPDPAGPWAKTSSGDKNSVTTD